MAVPKRKVSRTKRDTRRAHDRLTKKSLTTCPECSEVVFPHRACPHCGFYRGRLIVNLENE
ncbi:MAG: 50S ribosomal protein L32 [Deltaproteobacteria bacterium]|nr:MAG: 50S ribosomal protein L32 [Deltaproteobacteria bacterium]